MIRVTKAQFSNFLSFKQSFQLSRLDPITVIVGPNNAGKTNIIRAFKFYQSLLEASTDEKELPDMEKIFNMANKLLHNRSMDILVEYAIDDPNIFKSTLTVSHSIRFDSHGKFDSEHMIFEKFEEDSDLRKSRIIYKKEKEGDKYSYLEQEPSLISEFLVGHNPNNFQTTNPDGDFKVRDLKRFQPFTLREDLDLNAIKIIDFIKNFVRKWIFIPANRFTEYSDQNTQLDPNGRNIESILSKWNNTKRTPTDNFLKNIMSIFNIKDINFSEDGNKIILSDTDHMEVDLDNYGSGFEQFLIIFQRFFEQYIRDTIVFLEEPEVHLHPLLQRKLLQIIFRSSQHNQFFITTHSTIFCRCQRGLIKPYLIKKLNFESKIKEMNNELMEEIKSALGHVNSDVFGYNAVLFVEGKTEEKSIPLLAKNLDIDVVNDGLRIVNSETYGNLVQIRNLIELLKDTGTKVYAIYDNHRNTQGKLRDIQKTLSKSDHLELQKDYEYSFGGDILANVIEDLLKEKGITISKQEKSDLISKLNNIDNNTFEIAKNFYAQNTKIKITKIDLAESIACFLNNNSDYLGKSEVELFIKRIHEDIEKDLNVI